MICACDLHVQQSEGRFIAMQKKRLFWLILTTTLCTLVMTACGSGSTSQRSPVSAPPAVATGESLYILDGTISVSNGSAGQHIIAFRPGNASSTLTLPVGLFSQDHKRIYTAHPQNGQTTITITDTQTGATLRSFPLAGNYTTAAQKYTTSELTPDGRWLALLAQGQNDKASTIALVDTQTAQSRLIQLQGAFDLDAISPDGSRLYLLQHDEDQPGHYYVKRFDVSSNQLADGYIVDKFATSWDSMSGLALTRRMSADGTVAYTLYTDQARNIAFVHILPLTSSYPLARCITLPAGKTTDLLRHYTLALSSDGNTVYAANSALGVVVSIDVSHSNKMDQVLDDTIRSTGHFAPDSTSGNLNSPALYNGATLSPDQSMLYFVGTQGIWAVNTNNLQVKSHYTTGQSFTDIAISNDGHTLYAVSPISGLTFVDIASGSARPADKCPAHTPKGIAWVSN